jgi:3-oxoacyl-[acyl-carrier protein] reductase
VTLVCLTGASRGIGRATALELGRRGAELALWGRPSTAHTGTLAELRKLGAKAHEYACDLRDPAAIERCAALTLSEQGTPDVVIPNAGIIHRASIVETPIEQYDEQLAVNLRAPFCMLRALLPAMLERKSGRFVFVGSIASTLGSRHAATYAASKWGLLGLMKSLAEELRDTGLSTVAVLPGSVDTDMLVGSGFAPRMTAAEVATTVVYQALDAPSSHNGSAIEMFGV